jgi:hypothetical protein
VNLLTCKDEYFYNFGLLYCIEAATQGALSRFKKMVGLKVIFIRIHLVKIKRPTPKT